MRSNLPEPSNNRTAILVLDSNEFIYPNPARPAPLSVLLEGYTKVFHRASLKL
jgi:hypothetical protein